MSLTSEQVLLIQGALYTIALLYFLYKYKISVGAIVWSLYTLSSWATFLFVQQPMYRTGIHYSEQHILPCIYMFIINFIAMYPLSKLKNIPKIRFSSLRLLKLLMIACIVYQIIFFIVDFPYMVNILTSSNALLASIRNAGYDSAVLSFVNENVLLNKLSLLVSGIRLLATGLSVILLVCYKNNRRLVIVFFITTLLENIRIIITTIGRGEIVLLFLLYICMFYSLRHMITKKMYSCILISAIPVCIIGIAFFWIITISRFGNYASYTMYKYLGEPMNNFNGLLFYEIKGTTNGRAYFSLIYKYIFGQEDFVNTSDKWNLIYNMTGINGGIFYSWIGGLIIEFGKAMPVIAAVILNRSMSRINNLNEYLIGDLVGVVFLLNFFIRGIFIFPTQNYEGVFMIFYTLILFFAFRIKKNDKGHLVYVVPGSKHYL